MSNLILDRPTVQRATSVRATATAVGSYVDTHGVRRASRHVGSYTGTASGVGSYTGTQARATGSYVRSQR